MKYPMYGCIDVAHGCEHRFIYSGEEARLYFGDKIENVSHEPFGFVMQADLYVCEIANIEEAKKFLLMEAMVDLEDPTPIDLAEYYMEFCGENGITKEVCESLGLADIMNVRLEDQRLQELLDAGFPEEELYNEGIRESDIRFSEIMNIFEQGGRFKDILKEAKGVINK